MSEYANNTSKMTEAVESRVVKLCLGIAAVIEWFLRMVSFPKTTNFSKTVDSSLLADVLDENAELLEDMEAAELPEDMEVAKLQADVEAAELPEDMDAAELQEYTDDEQALLLLDTQLASYLSQIGYKGRSDQTQRIADQSEWLQLIQAISNPTITSLEHMVCEKIQSVHRIWRGARYGDRSIGDDWTVDHPVEHVSRRAIRVHLVNILRHFLALAANALATGHR